MKIKISHPLGTGQSACTGCGACAAACPANAISLQPDDEGFLHPHISGEICTDCGLCQKICPINSGLLANDANDSQHRADHLPAVYAAWHRDDSIRFASSSGGVFTALAENILKEGGGVVGAAFDDQLVVRHRLAQTLADMDRLRGSKYVQSEISPAIYRQIHKLLHDGRNVLFSGTPCQVASLRNFLVKDYDKLFCCDIVCLGVPSPLFFARYVQYNIVRGKRLLNISFRDKITGWKRYSLTRHLHGGISKSIDIFADPYMLAFLRNFALRPSCYNCKFKSTLRHGDLTLGDFWGVAKRYPEYDKDDQGTSLVLVNTEKGKNLLENCSPHLFLGSADLDTAIAGNPMLIRSANFPPERNTFYHDLQVDSFAMITKKYRLFQPSFLRRVFSAGKRRLIGTLNVCSN